MGATLVRRPVAPPREHEWAGGARRLLQSPQGFQRVLGGPGTGKTTLIAETAATRVSSGQADPERLLVLTTSRRAAEAMRVDITRRLTADPAHAGRTVREPMVRTVHSYA